MNDEIFGFGKSGILNTVLWIINNQRELIMNNYWKRHPKNSE